MTHDAVWFSRPRKFGKGSRQWCVHMFYAIYKTLANGCIILLQNYTLMSYSLGNCILYDHMWYNMLSIAASARIRLVLSASTALTSVVSASVRSLQPSVSSRYVHMCSRMPYCRLIVCFFTLRTGKRFSPIRPSLFAFAFLYFLLHASYKQVLYVDIENMTVWNTYRFDLEINTEGMRER